MSLKNEKIKSFEKMLNVYEFNWCVCSFDQRCRIKASSEEKAKEIFIKEVRDERSDPEHKWAAHYATCWNMSEVYLPSYIEKLLKLIIPNKKYIYYGT